MEAKRKKLTRKVVKKIEEDSRVSFDVFFAKQVKNGKLGFWQRQEILTFFKGKGLGDLEDQDKYEQILKLY